MTSREELVKESLNKIAMGIDSQIPKNFGFALLCFEFGEDNGRQLLYVSNADRKDIVKAMKEFIEKTEDNFGKHVE